MHMRWNIDDALNFLRFLRNERQIGELLTNEEISHAILIDDGVKIVMKSNLVDTSDGDDGYRTFYNLLELYDGNWLAALGTYSLTTYHYVFAYSFNLSL